MFRRYIKYRAASKRNSTSIIEQEKYRQKIGKINEISAIYQFGTNKSAKKSSVMRRVEQRRKPSKISEMYQGNIGDVFEIFFF